MWWEHGYEWMEQGSSFRVQIFHLLLDLLRSHGESPKFWGMGARELHLLRHWYLLILEPPRSLMGLAWRLDSIP